MSALKKASIVVVFLIIAGVFAYFINQEIQRQNSIPDDVKYFQDSSGDEYLTGEFATNDEISPQINANALGFEKATKVEDCEKSTPFLRGDCYKNFALKDNNPQYCEFSAELGQKDDCFYEVAISASNPEICRLMAFDIVDCFREVAVKTKDASVCEMAAFEKDACIQAVRNGDFEMCKSLGLNRSICNDAVDQKDSSLCNNIIDASKNCFYELALKTFDAKYCERVGEKANVCIFRVAMDSENIKFCNLLETQEEKDNCVARIAYKANNPGFCDYAGAEKQSCIEDLS